MRRRIRGFHRDDEDHWVAELDCGHGRHVRHHPPLSERPWVLAESGRRARLDTPLDCVRCDRRELPEGLITLRHTPVFDETCVPDGLRRRHRTRTGTWARIHVLAGRLRYRIHAPFHCEQILRPGAPGVVLPEVEHDVEPDGPVAFRVELLAAPRAE